MNFGDKRMRGQLVLVQHGQSTFNAENRFTGLRDAPLTKGGRIEAQGVGEHLRALGVRIDCAFSSTLVRASESAEIALNALRSSAPLVSLADLNERDYGALTGLNKAQAAQRWSIEQVTEWRRSYAIGPPEGESLRDVTARVAGAYLHHLLPAALAGSHVLIMAHGNSLRALIGLLEDLSVEALEGLEMATGQITRYGVHASSRLTRLDGEEERARHDTERDALIEAIEEELAVERGGHSKEG